MGLRGKIIVLFFAGFGLMALVAIELLQRDLLPSFVAIERNAALGQMEQLARNVDSELQHLRQATTDWANWDDMYRFATAYNPTFAADAVSPASLHSAGLTFLAIIDTRGKVPYSTTSAASGPGAPFAPFAQALDAVRGVVHGDGHDDSCGLARSGMGPVEVCWQPIRRVDHTGAYVGLLVIGRLADDVLVERIRRQSGIRFDWSLLPATAEAVAATPAAGSTEGMGPHAVQFSATEPGVLSARLDDIAGHPMMQLRLQYARDVSERGAATTWRVIGALLLVTLLNGLALLVGVHYLLVHRLRRLSRGLNHIVADGRWREMQDLPISGDEIGELGRDVNRLLQVIRDQVVSLESLARTDALTGIANRRAFDEALARQVRLHHREAVPLALVLIDVDFFKRYNDVYGHPAGDAVLKTLGTLLTLVARRPTDLAARIGGEEFGLILPGSDLPSALQVAEKLRALLAVRAIAHAGSPVAEVVTLSIGITLAGDEDPSALLLRADRAVYAAKESGRNRICTLDSGAGREAGAPEAGS